MSPPGNPARHMPRPRRAGRKYQLRKIQAQYSTPTVNHIHYYEQNKQTSTFVNNREGLYGQIVDLNNINNQKEEGKQSIPPHPK